MSVVVARPSDEVMAAIVAGTGSVACRDFRLALASVFDLPPEVARATARAALELHDGEKRRDFRARARLVVKRVAASLKDARLLAEAHRRAVPDHGKGCLCVGCVTHRGEVPANLDGLNRAARELAELAKEGFASWNGATS